MSYELRITRHEGWFHATVTGRNTIGNVDGYMSEVFEECRQAGCSLVGGETAEMPGLYKKGDYDLAGFVTGIIDRDKIIDGSGIKVGNKIIGLSSNGLHSNGFSLVRKICFSDLQLSVNDHIQELNRTLGEELLNPTRIYVKPILNMLQE